MEEVSPYQPPQTPEAQPPPNLPQQEPGVIKVFAIIHLVFGGIGIFSGLWGLLSPLISGRMVGLGMPSSPETDKIVNAQVAYMSEIQWVGVLGGVFTLVLAAMLIVSGIKLLKRQKAGLQWSNRYAWTSIGTKVVNLVVAFLVVVPASNRMVEGMMGELPGGSGGAMGSWLGAATAIGAIVGGVVVFVYPILTLVMLNRKPVKEFFERHGG